MADLNDNGQKECNPKTGKERKSGRPSKRGRGRGELVIFRIWLSSENITRARVIIF